MDCQEWMDEIVEGSRLGAPPRSEMNEHLDQCDKCRDLWDDGQSLAEPMRNLRIAVRGRRSPHYRRALLMDEYARVHGSRRRMGWALKAAASVLLALSAGLLWRTHAPAATGNAASRLAEAGMVAVPPEFSDESGFVPVPYASPLAQGEHVTVVRTQLQVAALDRMGFVVFGMNGNEYPAEVVLGQDGLPRAVRVLGEEEFEN